MTVDDTVTEHGSAYLCCGKLGVFDYGILVTAIAAMNPRHRAPQSVRLSAPRALRWCMCRWPGPGLCAWVWPGSSVPSCWHTSAPAPMRVG